MSGLFEELKRRNVVRVGIAYVIVAWLILQFSDLVLENIGAPGWVVQAIMLILAIGLPLALFFAWAFELTPEGLKTTKEVDRSESITHNTGRKLDRVIIGVLVIAVGYFLWERQQPAELPTTASEAIAEIEAPNTSQASEPAPAEAMRRSIAVLPFVNMSSDQEQEWFSDGLTEEILNALVRTPDLLVAARTSAFKFKGSAEDIRTIANALGVAHILEGSVRSGGDRLRVTAQLIRASDGFHLWSQTYDRNPEDVIAIQEEIAIEIATALETAMDPEALARMVSSGTRSVPAFNAYLQGLAYGASAISTGDRYTFLGARDSFERAIELDPEFSLAYWHLANFWRLQMSSINLVAGIVEMPHQEMDERFYEAIDKALETGQDPVNTIQYRVLRAMKNMQLTQALRLNTEYLERRPNDQEAQNRQLFLLASLGPVDKLIAAINEYQELDGYDTIVVQASIRYMLNGNDNEAIRAFTKTALERVGDSPFVIYQAHRALLWAGDVDGASGLSRLILSSDIPIRNQQFVRLRQACAENRLTDATRIYDQIKTDYPDHVSTMWISNLLMGKDQDAIEMMTGLDENEDLSAIGDFLSYAYFDARPFPNLMALLKAQGIEPREPLEIPYRCKF